MPRTSKPNHRGRVEIVVLSSNTLQILTRGRLLRLDRINISECVQLQNIRIDLVQNQPDAEQEQKAKNHVTDYFFCIPFVTPHVSLSHVQIASVREPQYRSDGADRYREFKETV